MAFFEQTRIVNAANTVINPAERQQLFDNNVPDNSALPAVRTAPGSVDDHLVLLRRMVKILENQQAVDSAQRQRVVIDTTAIAVLTSGANAIGSVTATIAAGANAIGSITNLASIAGWNNQLFVDPARTAYNSLRQQLTFTN